MAVTWRGQVVQGSLSEVNGRETVEWQEPDGKRRYCSLGTLPGHGWNHLVAGLIGDAGIGEDMLIGRQFQVHNPASKAAAFSYLNGRVVGSLATTLARAIGGGNNQQEEDQEDKDLELDEEEDVDPEMDDDDEKSEQEEA